MPDESGFLQALLDDPDDRAARLIFADWLDERGDRRGEFLRVQTELSGWVPDLDRRTELQKKERDWLARHEGLLLPGPLRPLCRTCRYEGGLGVVALSARRFLSRAFAADGAGWLRAGWVRTVRLFDLGGRVEALAESPALTGVAGLDLVNQDLTDADVRRLLASPHLEGLRELNLCNNHLTGPGLRALVGLPGFSGLRRLDVRNNAVTGVSLRAFLREAEALPLCRLEAHGNPLGRAGPEAWRDWAGRREPPTDRSPRRLLNSLGTPFVLVPAG